MELLEGPKKGHSWLGRAPGRAGARARGTGHTHVSQAAEKRDAHETDARNASRDARDAHSIVITRRPYGTRTQRVTDVCTRQIHSHNQTTRCSPGEPSFVSRVPYYATVCCVHFKTGSTTRRWSRSRATAAARPPRQRRASPSLDGAGASAAAAARGCRTW